MDCKDSTGEVFVNIMEKVVQAGLGTGARLFLEVLVQFPVMARGKPSENGQTGNILIKVYPFRFTQMMIMLWRMKEMNWEKLRCGWFWTLNLVRLSFMDYPDKQTTKNCGKQLSVVILPTFSI